MAWYRPTATNINWSTASNWETSSDATISTWGIANALPTINDYVYLHNRNVILDANATQSIKAALISNDALTPGYNISPTAKISSSAGGLISCSLANCTGSNSINITASWWAGTPTATAATALIFQTFTAASRNTINISGSITCLAGSGTTPQNIQHFIFGGPSSSINIIGDIKNDQCTVLYANASFITCSIFGNITNFGGITYLAQSALNGLSITVTGSITNLSNSNLTTPAYNNSAISMGGGGAGAAMNGFRIIVSGSIISQFSSPVIWVNSTGIAPTGSTTIIGDVYAGPFSPAYINGTPGTLNNASQSLTIFGNLYSHPLTGTPAVASPRLILTGSSTITLNQTYGTTSSFATSSANFNTSYYPATTNVRSGSKYGDGTNVSRTGSMIVPSVNDVRYGVPTETGSGLVFIPVTESVRLGVTSSQTNNVNSTGSVIIPLVSDVLLGAFVNTGSATGSYGTITETWNFPSSSLTASGTVGEDIKLSLDTNIGSITGSTLTELNNPNTIYSIAKRLQNIATTSSIIYQFSSSTN